MSSWEGYEDGGEDDEEAEDGEDDDDDDEEDEEEDEDEDDDEDEAIRKAEEEAEKAQVKARDLERILELSRHMEDVRERIRGRLAVKVPDAALPKPPTPTPASNDEHAEQAPLKRPQLSQTDKVLRPRTVSTGTQTESSRWTVAGTKTQREGGTQTDVDRPKRRQSDPRVSSVGVGTSPRVDPLSTHHHQHQPPPASRHDDDAAVPTSVRPEEWSQPPQQSNPRPQPVEPQQATASAPPPQSTARLHVSRHPSSQDGFGAAQPDPYEQPPMTQRLHQLQHPPRQSEAPPTPNPSSPASSPPSYLPPSYTTPRHGSRQHDGHSSRQRRDRHKNDYQGRWAHRRGDRDVDVQSSDSLEEDEDYRAMSPARKQELIERAIRVLLEGDD